MKSANVVNVLAIMLCQRILAASFFVCCTSCGMDLSNGGTLESLDLEGASSGVRIADARWETVCKKVSQIGGPLIDSETLPKQKTTWLKVAGTVINDSSYTASNLVLHVKVEGKRLRSPIIEDMDLRTPLAPGEKKEFEAGERYLCMGYRRITRCAGAILAKTQTIRARHSGYTRSKKDDLYNNATEADIAKANAYRQLRKKVLRITEDILIAKHNIQTTTDEIRAYLKRYITPDSVEEAKKVAHAQARAAGAMLEENLTPEQAAEKYMAQWGGSSLAPILKNFRTKEDVERYKARIPETVSDLVERSISDHRAVVQREALANLVLSSTQRAGSVVEWRPLYEKHILDYARENLLGVHPELKNISPEDLEPPWTNPNADQ